MKTTFDTIILANGNNTGVEVPAENLAELGSSKKPAVIVHLADYSYPSTVAVRGGRYLISLSKAHREAAGLKAGDPVTVTLELETKPRTVEVPQDLALALSEAGMQTKFDALAFSKRKEYVRQVKDAKAQATRERRIVKIVAQMKDA